MKKNELNALAERLKSGDINAAERLFNNIAPQAYRFFYFRVGHKETAEDLMQEVFLKVVANIHVFDIASGDFIPWFWRIARNSLIDFFRQKKPSYLSDLEGEGENIEDPHEKTHLNAELREIHNIVRTLPEEDQNIFNLYFVADLSYVDLAQVTGKSVASLRVRTYRLKQKILKKYEHEK
jgi:RNA polymerase sigma-70 factor (ECF subfamily)